MKKTLFGLLVLVVLALNCKKTIDVLPPIPPSLKDLPFPFGAAISTPLLKSDTAYQNTIIREFKSISTENAMKAKVIHPLENVYSWTDADEILAFAQKNGLRVHGHTLNWYGDQPDWITNFQGNQAAWEQMMKSHIQTIVGHYKGKVKSWDVVNEAFEDDGTLRNTIWLQKLGPDYIARAFQYAHEADPDAKLFYNDYGQEFGYEYKGLKRTAIIAMANDFIKRGIPIHGLGLQMHTKYTQSDVDISLAITTAAATGLLVHISELDVALNPNFDYTLVYSQSLAEMQASKYKAIVKIYNGIPKAQQYGITTWNVGDKDSWLPPHYGRPDWPLPFDTNYKPKLAYQGILDAVK